MCLDIDVLPIIWVAKLVTSYGVYHTSMTSVMCRINGEMKEVILGMATGQEASYSDVTTLS